MYHNQYKFNTKEQKRWHSFLEKHMKKRKYTYFYYEIHESGMGNRIVAVAEVRDKVVEKKDISDYEKW